MGWGRYTTRDIERLMVISIVAVVLAVQMPVYVKLRDVCLTREIALLWYHKIGLAVASGVIAILAVILFGLTLYAGERLVEYMTMPSGRQSGPPDSKNGE